jgi:hypothetical protein
MPGVNPIVTPQSQSAVERAKRAGMLPVANFLWSPGANQFMVWDGYVGINTAVSNVALETGGNLERIAANTAGLSGSSSSASLTSDTTVQIALSRQILAQLQSIALALGAHIVQDDTDFNADTFGGGS